MSQSFTIPGSIFNDGFYNVEERVDNLIKESEMVYSEKDREDYLKQEKQEADRTPKSKSFLRKNGMRNNPCPCGSGKKFKKCCWSKLREYSI